MGQAQGALQVHGRVEQGVAGNPGISSASLKDGDEQVARQDDPVEGLDLGAGIVVDVPDCGQMRQGTTQVLLRHDSERHWMRAAPARIRHLFPRLPSQSEYNRHLRALAPALLQAARWPTRATPPGTRNRGWWTAPQCAPGPCPLVCDKRFAAVGIERAAAGPGHVLVRPPRKDESPPRLSQGGCASGSKRSSGP